MKIEIDEHIAEEATNVLSDLSLDLITAINLFLEEVVRTKDIPFKCFYSKSNIAHLKKVIDEYEGGQHNTDKAKKTSDFFGCLDGRLDGMDFQRKVRDE